MSSIAPSLLALLIGMAGWYYLFYSRAAHKLGTVEPDSANARRILFRRANGLAMLVMAILLYIGTRGISAEERPRTFLAVWMGVILVLLIVVALAFIDVRLTVNLRRQRRRSGKK